MSESDSETSFLDCKLVGECVYTDNGQKLKFYTEVAVNNLNIRLGDVVKVQIQDENVDIRNISDEYSFGIILAIFEDFNEVISAEVRWLLTKRDLNSRLLRLFNSEKPLENELILSERLDDIPVGSIVELVNIKGYQNPSQDINEDNRHNQHSSVFICRFLSIDDSYSLQPIDFSSAYQQGLELSHFRFAYNLQMYNIPGIDTKNNLILDPYSEAIKRLHISIIPDRLPCRTQDQDKIIAFIMRGLKCSGEGIGPLLISGMPGSGKTATVLASVRSIQNNQVKKKEVPEFEYVEINCLRIRKPDDSYAILWHAISDETVSGSKALKNLNQYFMPDAFKASSITTSMTVPIVCMLDEMEFLITKNQTAMYNFLNWSRAPNAQFVLIGVANAMDVVERVLLGSNASRSTVKTTQLPFSSYTFHDITAILSDRISSLSIPGVDNKTIETCARKAATFTGDIRTALKIFQRALELLREESMSSSSLSSNSLSNDESRKPGSSDFSKLIALVKRATEAYVYKPYIYMLQQSCLLDQTILIAICKNTKVTGGNTTLSVETIWYRLHDLLTWAKNSTQNNVVKFSIEIPPIEIFYQAINRLLEEGFLGEALSSNRGKTWHISENILAYDLATIHPILLKDSKRIQLSSMVGVRLEFGDIIGALRGINGLVAYVDG